MAKRASGITLQQMQYFIDGGRRGVHQRRSRLLYVAQPTMSGRDARLETRRRSRPAHPFSARVVTLTVDGVDVLGYARQVVEQAELLEQRYLGRPPSRRLLGVSAQHYSFVVDAFVRMVKATDARGVRVLAARDPHLRHHRRRPDVAQRARHPVPQRLQSERPRQAAAGLGLAFHPLFRAEPAHLRLATQSARHARARDPRRPGGPPASLTFDQGANNSFYFAEEILSTLSSKQEIGSPTARRSSTS